VSFRYLLTFRKHEAARFLSHLDLQATLEYGMRRAGLPLELSEGFNPRPRYSLVAALPLGYVGERELLEMTLRDDLEPGDVAAKLQSALPDGITILSGERLAAGSSAGAGRLRSATYRLELAQPVADLDSRVAQLLSEPELIVEDERNGRKRKQNKRALVLALSVVEPQTLRLVTELTVDGSVRPEEILRLLSLDPTEARMTREAIEIEPEKSARTASG
jgi:radical SAM-linked protein